MDPTRTMEIPSTTSSVAPRTATPTSRTYFRHPGPIITGTRPISRQHYVEPRGTRLLCCLVVVLVAASCTHDRVNSEPRSPITEKAARKVQEKLLAPYGFVAPASADLLGLISGGLTAYRNGEPVIDEGWTAVFDVSGDPRPVVDALVVQSAAAGLPLLPAANPVRGTDPSSYCARKGPSYSCFGIASAGDGRFLELNYVSAPGADGRPTQNWLTLRLSIQSPPDGRPQMFTAFGVHGAPLGPDPPRTPRPTAAALHAGDRVRPDGTRTPGLKLQEGDRLLALSSASPDSCNVGYWVLIESSDGRRSVGAHVRALGGLAYVPTVRLTDARGTRVSQYGAAPRMDGPSYRILLMQHAGVPDLVWIEACGSE